MVDLPRPLTKKSIQKIYTQMSKSFFIRKEKDEKFDFGFF